MCCLQCEICVGKNREIHFNNFSTVFFCCFARKRKKALHDDSTHTSPLPFIKKLAIVAYRHCFMLHTHTLVAWNFVLFFSKIIFVRFDQFVKYLFVFYLQTTTLHYVESWMYPFWKWQQRTNVSRDRFVKVKEQKNLVRVHSNTQQRNLNRKIVYFSLRIQIRSKYLRYEKYLFDVWCVSY